MAIKHNKNITQHKSNNTEGKKMGFNIDKFDKTTWDDTDNNPILLLNDIVKWYYKLHINKFNIQIQ